MANEPRPLVYLDTTVWLQTMNGQEPHDLADKVIVAASAGRIDVVCSWLVRAEIQTAADPGVPQDVRDSVDKLLDGSAIRWVAVDRFVANKAREISRSGVLPRPLAGADAIHLATAIREGASHFMALDRRFPYGKAVEGVYVSEPAVVWQEDLFGQ